MAEEVQMYEKIVVAVDGSEESRRAVQQAGGLARVSGGEVRVIHVREHSAYGMAAGAYPVEEMSVASAVVDGVVQGLVSDGIKATGTIQAALVGRVAAVVVDDARSWGADVIVVGSRGLGALSGMLLGSVAQKLIHLAPCPVLVVR